MQSPNEPIKLIVGLGNPGSDYEKTRHNAGQDFVQEIADKFNQPLKPSPKFFGLDARVIVNNRDLRLLIPTTFMNRSGQAVAAISQFYKIDAEKILVVHDELDLAPGVAKLKIGGGHGGHNGLRDIISSMGNNKNFARLRLGIGHPGNSKQVASFVLKRAPASEQDALAKAMQASHRIIEDLITGDWDKAMRELHTN